jgi:hypothetical protein
LCALALLALLPVAALAQPQPPTRDVTVQNETDLTLQQLFIAAPGAADRGPDRLGADVVAPGASYGVRLGRSRDCVFDVTAIYEDGTEEQRRRVDLCRAPRLVFGDPQAPRLEVQVANRSPVMLRELYAQRSQGRAAEAWGPDRLGAGVIEPGGGFTLRLRSRDCVFDLRAVYADEREEMRAGADLCATRDIAFDRAAIPRVAPRSVVLANRHLAPLQEAYLSPSEEQDWGPDRLGSTMLGLGQDTTIEMEGGCEADLRVVFPGGGAEERRAIDICETRRIVIRPGWTVAAELDEEGAVPAPAPVATGALRLRNAGPLPIVEIYTGEPGGPRGEDRLGADTLPIGMVVEIEPPDANACQADLVVVFRDGREVVRAGVDLCSGEEIEVR